MLACLARRLWILLILAACTNSPELFDTEIDSNGARWRIGGNPDGNRRLAGKHPDVQHAIDGGLAWLATQRHAKGGWGESTAFALLTFLSRGSTATGGPYREEVKFALAWLERQTQPTGIQMALTAWAQADAALLWRDAQLAGRAKLSLRKVLASRRSDGTWGTHSDDSQCDVQATCTSLVALQAGVELRCVEASELEPSLTWLREQSPSTLSDPADLACWVWCRFACDRQFRMRLEIYEAISPLMASASTAGQSMTFMFYATHAIYSAGRRDWERWCETVVARLVQSQATVGPAKGSWSPVASRAKKPDGVLTTAQALLALEAFYRYSRMVR